MGEREGTSPRSERQTLPLLIPLLMQKRGQEALTETSPPCRYIGALGARVICDNIPGLVSRQRQLCQRYPDIMRSVGEGAREWIRECQHQFRHHRWNCTTLDRDHTVFGRVMLRSRGVFHPAPAPSLSMLGVVSGRVGMIPSPFSTHYFIIRETVMSRAQGTVGSRSSVL